MNWQADKRWADQFTPQIVGILKQNSARILSIEVASLETDTLQATDMIITVHGGNVAVRIRRDTPYRDFTIRSSRISGAKTELQKLREGFCDWYLYAWSCDGTIKEWVLIDLHRVRYHELFDRPWRELLNKDRQSTFIAIPLSVLMLNNCVVSRSLE